MVMRPTEIEEEVLKHLEESLRLLEPLRRNPKWTVNRLTLEALELTNTETGRIVTVLAIQQEARRDPE